MKTKLMKIALPVAVALITALLAAMPVPAQAEHDRGQVVTRDRNGNPVYDYQLMQCGVEYQHRAHWFSTPRSSHDHYCDGSPHRHEEDTGRRRIRY